MSETICPCDAPAHPRRIWNPPGLDAVDYRIGDYAAFRAALLRARPGEQALAEWQPGAEGDLAVQLIEWWAYLADVLVFYNERALGEILLRTARFPEDVRRIIRLLGYRPRPGIAATGVVAALLDTTRPVIVPRGFPIQGAVASGGPPQVFEVDRESELGLLGRALPPSARFPTPPGVTPSTWTGYAERDTSGNLLSTVPARPKRDKRMPEVKAGKPVKVAVKGLVTNVNPGDVVLILKRDWDGDILDQLPGRALTVVHELDRKFDEAGLPVTVLTLRPGQSLPFGPDRSEYRLIKATKMSHLWLYHDRYPGMKSPSVAGFIAQAAEQFFDPLGLFSGGISTEPPQDPHALTSSQLQNPLEGAAHLEAITRGISPGDPVLFEQKLVVGGIAGVIAQMFNVGAQLDSLARTLEDHTAFLVKVSGYAESIWYANPPEGDRIGQGPPIGPPSDGLLSGGAAPIPIPHSKITFSDPFFRASLMSADDTQIKTIVVHYAWQEVGDLVDVPATGPTTTPEVPGHDAVPPGVALPVIVEDVTGAGVPSWIGVTPTTPGPPLVGRLRALVNLLPVSRGQTVTGEVLGSGSSILVNQELALKRAPLTYLTDAGPESINGYRSTLEIRVDGLRWREVPSFFEQPADARVYVTREDDQQRTYVRFGDGVHGARLPTGTDNVVASYRYGSGAEVPPIGALTGMLRPQRGLQSIRNPIQPGGGADPDPPEHIRRYAPRSVLTFGRAISGDDYQTVAAQTPGVSRAKVVWGWDPAAQRSRVKVFVGDDDAAVSAAREALRAFSDPNRPVLVAPATPIRIRVSFTLEVEPDREPPTVQAAVAAALLDRGRAPFGLDVVQIDEVLYDSEIYDAVLAVPGVVAVHHLEVRIRRGEVAAAYPISISPPGFTGPFQMWTATPFLLVPLVLALPTAASGAPLSAESTAVNNLRRPPWEPLTDEVRATLGTALTSRRAAVDATLPAPQPTTEPPEVWDLDPGERHAPGEGRFYLLHGDQLHIATEVWRHGR